MRNTTQLEHEITSLFKDQLHLEVPSGQTDLVAVGILDSMTFVDLLTHLEHQYDFLISPDMLEIENFKSVSRIAAFVESQLGRKK